MEWLINRRRMMFYREKPPVYLVFEDTEVGNICAKAFGDYDERVITDNGDNTVNIVDSFVSMKNRTERRRDIINTQTNVDNTGGTYVAGTYKTPRGITLKQCKSVTSLGNGRFDYTTNPLTGSPFKNNTSITTFPELAYFTNVKTIERECFYGCSNLEFVDFRNITSVDYQFADSSKIASYVFEDGFTTMKLQSLYRENPTRLYIDLPSTTTTIGEWNFRLHPNMVIVCRATTPPVLSKNNNAGKALYVPQSAIEAYSSASYWSYFATNNKIHPIEGSYYENHKELNPNE